MITNFKELVTTPLRKKALVVAEAGYETVDIKRAVSERIKLRGNILEIKHQKSRLKLNINNFDRVFVVGIGKSSALASATLAGILGGKLTRGIALDVNEPKLKIRNRKLEIFTGTHPLPSQQNIVATKKIIELAKNLNEKDLLITFICGGGSALACGSEREVDGSILATKELTKAGADIIELNTVRKHLSEFKGGGLAKFAHPATIVSLVVSDVLGNDLSMVASGPTVLDMTTKDDALKVLKKYKISPGKFSLRETPKEERYFRNTKNILFISNMDAVAAMLEKAKKLGFKARIYSSALKGEAKSSLLPLIEEIKPGEAFIAAGETTVTLKGTTDKSKGGRNQEAVLGALVMFLDSNLVILSIASDGHDNTEAAGAIGDIYIMEKARKMRLNPLEFVKKHNSFHFFQKTNGLVFAEPKSFNVSDLVVILRKH